MFYLDTNACVVFLRGKSEALRDRLLAEPPSRLAIPSIVEAELLLGARLSADPDATAAAVRAFLAPFAVEPFGSAAAPHYAAVRATLQKRGELIGPNDLIVAATVLAAGGVLVTHNTKEFVRVPGLLLEDWQ
ncbi:MAG: type II toxin-antitoxin system VapC family toxin [Propionibacteriaceae bacterium]|jgi:tRNA(fMet)-specific endonuclease VapC|nr:type II toxin-antitoxin system VapC family toxin [Propionibacteriaceae bacterium]